MKVRELIEALQDMNPENLVIMSSDPEGNSYKELYNVAKSFYHTEDDYEFEVLHPEDLEDYEDCEPEQLKEGVVFWP